MSPTPEICTACGHLAGSPECNAAWDADLERDAASGALMRLFMDALDGELAHADIKGFKAITAPLDALQQSDASKE